LDGGDGLSNETNGTACASAPAIRLSSEEAARVDVDALASAFDVGVPTLRDILDGLARPGRDPRTDLPGPIFKKGILKLADLQAGMELQGTVLNVVDFGAFVDVGLKDSGLVHISQLSPNFVRSPHDLVSVGDVVTVWVLAVDQDRKRLSLTMIRPGTPPAPKSPRPPRRFATERKSTTEPGAAPAAASMAGETEAGSVVESPADPQPRLDHPHRAKRKRHKQHRVAEQELPPLSANAIAGGEPLTSFGQLKQLWNQRDQEP
jgi:uncharacterized protein